MKTDDVINKVISGEISVDYKTARKLTDKSPVTSVEVRSDTGGIFMIDCACTQGDAPFCTTKLDVDRYDNSVYLRVVELSLWHRLRAVFSKTYLEFFINDYNIDRVIEAIDYRK